MPSQYHLLQYHTTLKDNIELIIIIHKHYILTILGPNLGNTFKFSPLPPEDPLGFALGNSLNGIAVFDPLSLVLS